MYARCPRKDPSFAAVTPTDALELALSRYRDGLDHGIWAAEALHNEAPVHELYEPPLEVRDTLPETLIVRMAYERGRVDGHYAYDHYRVARHQYVVSRLLPVDLTCHVLAALQAPDGFDQINFR
jgi:hypothetical protein